MKNKHRKILSELCGHCNSIGGELDGTSTHESKYKDRQRAHMLVYKVLYGVLTDHPDNEDAEENISDAETALSEIQLLTKKIYPDRKGNL